MCVTWWELPFLACTASLTVHGCTADPEQRRRGHPARSQSLLCSGTGLARQQGHSSFHAEVGPSEGLLQQLDEHSYKLNLLMASVLADG